MRKSQAQRYAKLSDAELIAMFKDFYESVHITDCFGTQDLIELNMLERELERRGYEIRATVPEIVKAEPEEDEPAAGDGSDG